MWIRGGAMLLWFSDLTVDYKYWNETHVMTLLKPNKSWVCVEFQNRTIWNLSFTLEYACQARSHIYWQTVWTVYVLKLHLDMDFFFCRQGNCEAELTLYKSDEKQNKNKWHACNEFWIYCAIFREWQLCYQIVDVVIEHSTQKSKIPEYTVVVLF